MPEPLVSVIIPTYNREKQIYKAIQSVLRQTFSAFEIIIVDDASTDGTERVVNSFSDSRILYIRHKENKNGSAARNTGIRAAKGVYIALLDSDDEWDSHKLERQFVVMESLPHNLWGGTYCGFTYVMPQASRNVIPTLKGDLTLQLFQKELDIGASSTLLFCREVFDTVGYFDETYERHQDLEFLIRYFRKYQLHVLEELLVKVYGPNMPKGDKSAKIKEKFLAEFKQDIERFGPKTANQIYTKHWEEVAKAYAREVDIRNCLKFTWIASSYSSLPLNRKKSLFVVYMKSLLKKLLMFIGLRRS